jgi:hypothetical protein
MPRRPRELNPCTIESFRDYCSTKLGDDIASFIETGSQHIKLAHSEGTIRGGLFAVLRMKLPDTWGVQAEVAYPENMGLTTSRADVLVHRPGGEPIVFEVKPRFNEKQIVSDLRKIKKHVELKTSAVRTGYVVFGFDPNEHTEEDLSAALGDFLEHESVVQAIAVRLG